MLNQTGFFIALFFVRHMLQERLDLLLYQFLLLRKVNQIA